MVFIKTIKKEDGVLYLCVRVQIALARGMVSISYETHFFIVLILI